MLKKFKVKFKLKFKFKRTSSIKNIFQNINIGKKYGLILVVIFILFSMSATIASKFIIDIGHDVDTLERRGDRALKISEMDSLTESMGLRIANYVHYSTQSYIDDYNLYREQFNSLEAEIRSEMDTQEQVELLNQIVTTDESVNDLITLEIIPAVQAKDFALAKRFAMDANNLQLETIVILDVLRNIVNEASDLAVTQAKEKQQLALIVLLASVITTIIVGSIMVFLISRIISRNLSKVVNITTEVASGNLAVESMDYESKDEIGQLAGAVNQMKNNIRDILVKVTNASQSVSSSSEELTQTTNEVNEGGEQIASTMAELASGAELQANSASDLSEHMSNFVETVHISEQEGLKVATTSKDVLHLTNEGTILMTESMEQMKRIDLIVSEAVEQVQGLDKRSNEISQLVLVIQDIADQTNLLSLNAAIEAARAGEHGLGFAVVADEVRKLAEKVSLSVSEITGIVTNIHTETDTVVNSLNRGYTEVKEGTEQIEKTGKNFETIDNSVSDMVEKIGTISTNLKYISKNSNHMNHLIQDIASVSEESAAGVQQAAATTEETSGSMDEISYSADELAKLAEQLNDEISVFRLN